MSGQLGRLREPVLGEDTIRIKPSRKPGEDSGQFVHRRAGQLAEVRDACAFEAGLHLAADAPHFLKVSLVDGPAGRHLLLLGRDHAPTTGRSQAPTAGSQLIMNMPMSTKDAMSVVWGP